MRGNGRDKAYKKCIRGKLTKHIYRKHGKYIMADLFDLHCDTLGIMYRMKSFDHPISYQLDIESCSKVYSNYSQVFAVYSPNSYTEDEAWDNFLHTCIKIHSHVFPKNVTPYLAVEGGKLLNGKSERLKDLKKENVSVLTLVWGGLCCIGGASNTDEGLTDFGRYVLDFCLDNGIVPDVSHASDKMFWEVANVCSKKSLPFIASHSCSRAIRHHHRNLTDEMFTVIAECGGVVGVSLAPPHISGKRPVTIDDVADHILHYLSLGHPNAVALGCDYDGIDNAPIGLEAPEKLLSLYPKLESRGVDRRIIDKVTYKNAYDFFKNNKLRSIR